jgi:hypothetical protein
VLAPSHYAGTQTPLRDAYDRLEPYASALTRGITVVPSRGTELCRYLARNPLGCKFHDWGEVRALASRTGSFDRALEQLGVNVLYADSGVLADPLASTLKPVRQPWTKIAGDGDQWLLLRREQASKSGE